MAMLTEKAPADPSFEALLLYLKRTRGFDFTLYKRPSLMRRVALRLAETGTNDFDEYRDYLEVHPDEFALLFDVLLLHVTAFFRDAPVWERLREDVLPRLLSLRPETEPIRVWSAGCATGQEAYSVALLLVDALGPQAFQRRVRIYATDLDEGALATARAAVYSAKEVSSVPPELLHKYFERMGTQYALRKEVRRGVIFGRHNLHHDAAISRVDLLTCRNVLMYFQAEAQTRIMSRLQFALREDGVLALGKAETMFANAPLLAPLDLKLRLFVKQGTSSLPERLLGLARRTPDDRVALSAPHLQMRSVAFEGSTVAQVVVDGAGLLYLANELARSLFHLARTDVGRPFQDLELSYRPLELRSVIDECYNTRLPQSARAVRWPTKTGDVITLEILVMPLLDVAGYLLGASITFNDVTRFQRLQSELEDANKEIETAYEELQSTNEELETTNEELQSTVEELETTNEELHSTNEELETMNAELQSTNDELQAVNGDARARSSELKEVNLFMECILSSLRPGVVVLNADLLVQVWSGTAEDLWGLRASEVEGKPFLSLEIGLPLEPLREPLRAALFDKGSTTDMVLAARNRRGKDFLCQVHCTPLVGANALPSGVILLMETAPEP